MKQVRKQLQRGEWVIRFVLETNEFFGDSNVIEIAEAKTGIVLVQDEVSKQVGNAIYKELVAANDEAGARWVEWTLDLLDRVPTAQLHPLSWMGSSKF